MKEFEVLLENFWITKDVNKDMYYAIKDNYKHFKHFVEDKLGYKLVLNSYVARLEKLPGKAEAWMGIQEFDDTLCYAFLCLLLVFLEDRSAGEQFVLSELTEFLQAAFTGEDRIDWTLFRHRKAMVKVMRFADVLQLIKVDDGDGVRFMENAETEVLYESTGLSRYFVRNFTGNILNYDSIKDIENGEWLDVDRDRGRVRRNRVYRRLFMSPAVYSEGADDQDYLYIKNKKGMLQKDIEDMLGGQLHVHRNGAFVILPSHKHFREVFPDSKGICDVVLQINTLIVGMLKDNELQKRGDDTIHISKVKFMQLTEKCKDRFGGGWSKEYREMKIDRLCEEAAAYMKGFSMLEEDSEGREYRIMPMAGKLNGNYPEDFGIRQEAVNE